MIEAIIVIISILLWIAHFKNIENERNEIRIMNHPRHDIEALNSFLNELVIKGESEEDLENLCNLANMKYTRPEERQTFIFLHAPTYLPGYERKKPTKEQLIEWGISTKDYNQGGASWTQS